MIDLAGLTSLRAIDTQGSVVGAAAVLGYTPSAVSQQIKRLERQAGVPLLERVGRGVILTQHGRYLVDRGGRLLADLEEIEAGLHQQATTVAGRLRLTSFSTALRGLVAPAAAAVLARHPELDLRLTEADPWDTVDLVATGGTDLGIVHNWGDVPLAIPDHLAVVPITTDVADVIVPAGHPLAGRRQVSPRDLAEVEWVATPDGTICRQWLARMYDGTGRLPRIAHQSAEFDVHLALVRAGLGVALIPRLGRSPLPDGVLAVPVVDPVPTREVLAVHRRSMASSPAVAAVLEALRALPLVE